MTNNNAANDRNETIAILKAELKRRSRKVWSVTGGKGTAWGWITITAPPKRCNEFGSMTEDDRAELAALLGFENVAAVHHQGASIAASRAYRAEYIARAEGRTPEVIAQPYWD